MTIDPESSHNMIDSRCEFVPVDSHCSNPTAIAVDQMILLLTALRSSLQELDGHHVQKSRVSAILAASMVKCQVPFRKITHGALPRGYMTVLEA